MVQKAAQHYRNHQVKTASPVSLVAMLYEKAITSLNDAIRAIEAGEIEKRWRANNRAVEIVTVLAATLDGERGGEIAENLDRIYQFILGRLIDVDLRNDAQAARDVIELLQPLHDSWRQIADQAVEVQEQQLKQAETVNGNAKANGSGKANGNGNGNGKDGPATGREQAPTRAEHTTGPRSPGEEAYATTGGVCVSA